jgi:integrase
MATVYKRRELRPIPEGAEITTYRGKPYAIWTDAKGKARRAPLNEAGNRIVQVADTYTAQYFDENGKRRKASTGCGDKATAQQVADRIQSEVALRKRGIINVEQEQLADAGRRTLAQHLADFQASMTAAGRTSGHVTRTVAFIRETLDAAGYVVLTDIKADGVNRYASDLTTKGKAARTVQARLTAIKSFTRWLTTHGKLARDPLASVRKPNPKADRRHERRMLLYDEWDWIRATTEQGSERYGMTGKERMLLYAVAIQTGLRSGECRSLTRARLFLDSDPPYVTAKAGNTKNRKDARQYIQPGLAAELAEHIATKTTGASVFSMPEETNVARMFRADLADARQAWLESTKDPEERLRREQSDFLQAVNHDGAKADFHALRHTTGAWLALAGNHPKVIQTLMRHSTITLTMDTYGHLFPGQDVEALASLPDILGSDIPEAQRATGTDGRAVVRGHMRGQWGRKTLQDTAGRCEPDGNAPTESGCRNVLAFNALSDNRRDVAKRDESRPGGIRTPDQGIMSQFQTSENTGETGISGNAGADAGAIEMKSAHDDADLGVIIDAWPTLPEAIRSSILAMVKAAGGDGARPTRCKQVRARN